MSLRGWRARRKTECDAQADRLDEDTISQSLGGRRKLQDKLHGPANRRTADAHGRYLDALEERMLRRDIADRSALFALVVSNIIATLIGFGAGALTYWGLS